VDQDADVELHKDPVVSLSKAALATFTAKRETLSEVNENALFADGFEEALIGIVERFGQEPVALYDRDMCIEILKRDMDEDEAEEFFCFNVIGSWVGEGTPAFAIMFSPGPKPGVDA